MKRPLTLFLLAFSLLLNLYLVIQAVQANKKIQNDQQLLQANQKSLKDSLENCTALLYKANEFSLKTDIDAQNYLYKVGLNEDQTAHIEDAVYEFNSQKGGSPLVPYEQMERPFIIDNARVLNHRWIVADFTDGKIWGQVLLEYFYETDKGFDFELLSSLVYPTD